MTSKNMTLATLASNVTFSMFSENMTLTGLVSTSAPNPFFFVSESVFQTLKMVFNGFLCPAFTVFGMLANMTTILVLTRMGFKDTTNIIMCSLAVWDFMFLLLAFVRRLESIISVFDADMATDYYAYSTVYIFSISRACMFMSFIHIVVIAVERFVAVFFPFKVSIWITNKRIVILLGVITILSMITLSPIYARFKIGWVFSERRNKTVPVAILTDFYQEQRQSMDAYINGFFASFLGVSSLTIVSLCSAAISFKLAQISKIHLAMSSQSTSKQRAQRTKSLKVSRMLLTVCIVYISTTIPTIFFLTSRILFGKLSLLSQVFDLLLYITETLLVINSCANFIIYTCMASKFYETLKTMMCC